MIDRNDKHYNQAILEHGLARRKYYGFADALRSGQELKEEALPSKVEMETPFYIDLDIEANNIKNLVDGFEKKIREKLCNQGLDEKDIINIRLGLEFYGYDGAENKLDVAYLSEPSELHIKRVEENNQSMRYVMDTFPSVLARVEQLKEEALKEDKENIKKQIAFLQAKLKE